MSIEYIKSIAWSTKSKIIWHNLLGHWIISQNAHFWNNPTIVCWKCLNVKKSTFEKCSPISFVMSMANDSQVLWGAKWKGSRGGLNKQGVVLPCIRCSIIEGGLNLGCVDFSSWWSDYYFHILWVHHAHKMRMYHTVEPLYSGHHWFLEMVSAIERCPL